MAAFLGSCCAGAEPHSAMMDEIEGKIRLPAGAGALPGYDRYYAEAPGGLIAGSYVSGNFHRKYGYSDCMSDISRDIICKKVENRNALMRIHKRVYLEDMDIFPGGYDGGCDFVAFTFDPKSGDFVNPPVCNGSV